MPRSQANMTLCSVLVCSLLLLATVPGQATTYYVATNGDDSRSCGTAQNINAPKQTINNGAGCLQGGGDTLLIRGGTYTEQVTTPNVSGTSWNNPVWIGAYQSETVTIRGVGGDHTLNMGGGGDYIIFDHLHIGAPSGQYYAISTATGRVRFQHGEATMDPFTCTNPYTSSPGNAIFVNAGGIEIQFIDNDVHDAPCDYGFYVHGANVLIDGNRIYNNAGYGIQVYSGETGCCLDNIIIRNNLIYNNDVQNHGHCGITFNHGQDGLIYNNIIYGNKCGLGVSNNANNAGVYNNTIYNNTTNYAGIQIQNVQGVVVRNNILYLNGGSIDDQGSSTVQSNNLTTDPQFVNAPNGDFHLQAGSTAIGFGANLFTVFTTDFAGSARPPTGAWTAGAYVFGGSPLPAPTNLRLISVTNP